MTIESAIEHKARRFIIRLALCNEVTLELRCEGADRTRMDYPSVKGIVLCGSCRERVTAKRHERASNMPDELSAARRRHTSNKVSSGTEISLKRIR
ncbi:MAG: hypothetical protein QOI88_4089 [Gammaproteobacteria bacterium]|jgi:hypothetical protein|nr:hypothetical protein [Gammaproteobacteria bacterium]